MVLRFVGLHKEELSPNILRHMGDKETSPHNISKISLVIIEDVGIRNSHHLIIHVHLRRRRTRQ